MPSKNATQDIRYNMATLAKVSPEMAQALSQHDAQKAEGGNAPDPRYRGLYAGYLGNESTVTAYGLSGAKVLNGTTESRTPKPYIVVTGQADLNIGEVYEIYRKGRQEVGRVYHPAILTDGSTVQGALTSLRCTIIFVPTNDVGKGSSRNNTPTFHKNMKMFNLEQKDIVKNVKKALRSESEVDVQFSGDIARGLWVNDEGHMEAIFLVPIRTDGIGSGEAMETRRSRYGRTYQVRRGTSDRGRSLQIGEAVIEL